MSLPVDNYEETLIPKSGGMGLNKYGSAENTERITHFSLEELDLAKESSYGTAIKTAKIWEAKANERAKEIQTEIQRKREPKTLIGRVAFASCCVCYAIYNCLARDQDEIQFSNCAKVAVNVTDILDPKKRREDERIDPSYLKAYVCKDDHDEIKAMMVCSMEEKEVFIYDLVSNPDNLCSPRNEKCRQQTKGAGKFLLHQLEEIARSQNKKWISLNALHTAIDFYAKQGYSLVPTRRLPTRMIKWLK